MQPIGRFNAASGTMRFLFGIAEGIAHIRRSSNFIPADIISPGASPRAISTVGHETPYAEAPQARRRQT